MSTYCIQESGINASVELTTALKEMEQINKNKYDFIVIHLNKLPSKGTKIDYGIDIGKKQETGESEKKYEGKDLGACDAVFQDVKDMLLSAEYKDDACFVQFYLNYNLEGNRAQNKLMFLSWYVLFFLVGINLLEAYLGSVLLKIQK